MSAGVNYTQQSGGSDHGGYPVHYDSEQTSGPPSPYLNGTTVYKHARPRGSFDQGFHPHPHPHHIITQRHWVNGQWVDTQRCVYPPQFMQPEGSYDSMDEMNHSLYTQQHCSAGPSSDMSPTIAYSHSPEETYMTIPISHNEMYRSVHQFPYNSRYSATYDVSPPHTMEMYGGSRTTVTQRRS
jgi:hypothetical protein